MGVGKGRNIVRTGEAGNEVGLQVGLEGFRWVWRASDIRLGEGFRWVWRG